MLYLKELQVGQFKNIREERLVFGQQYICFTGNNGVGKTNMLDAIHYLSIGKSYFNPIDHQNILDGENYFNLRGFFSKNEEPYDVFVGFVSGKRKKLKKNGVDYERLSEHVGNFPVVMITPYDNSLITGGSEERRRFVDAIISQIDKTYLHNLIDYNKAIKQRNAQLKWMFEQNLSDHSLLQAFDKVLVESGNYIHEKRKSFAVEFSGLFDEYYTQISEGRETVSLNYKSKLETQDMKGALAQNLKKDLVTHRTNAGIHKDEIELKIFDFPAKRFASQGQQKSFLLSMKLAQFNLFRKHK